MNLEFYTNEELVQELSHRDTFAGVIVYSPKNVKQTETHQDWRLEVNNLKEDQVLYLFDEFKNRITDLY
jgi:hypothetical protein